MANDPLSPAEQDLTSIAARNVADGFLHDLIMLAEDGLGFSVGLLLDGMIVVGTIAPSGAIAEDIDTQLRTLAEAAAGERGGDEDWRGGVLDAGDTRGRSRQRRNA
jgi:hypothetical protein